VCARFPGQLPVAVSEELYNLYCVARRIDLESDKLYILYCDVEDNLSGDFDGFTHFQRPPVIKMWYLVLSVCVDVDLAST
jgi:hypothetical protein